MRTRPATNKERALCTHDPRSGGAYVVDDWDNAWRSGAPGPHAHGNAARQVVDGLRTEVWGQQRQSNDPPNNQHNPIRQLLGAANAQILPHSAQPDHTNHGAPRTRKRYQQEHQPQRPTERSDPTQHAEGRKGDCPGPRKETTTRRNVTQGGWVGGSRPPTHPPSHPTYVIGPNFCFFFQDQLGGQGTRLPIPLRPPPPVLSG